MESKLIRWIVLILSILLIIGVSLVILRDTIFFVSKKEASGKIVNTDIQSSGYRIRVSYFNKYKGINVTTTVKIKNSYKKFIQNFEKTIPIYYSKFFPKHVYVKGVGVPKKGIIIFELIFIGLLCLSAKFGFEGIH
jgi:hypothetical protein